jgi:NDP-sugar pyrophosphorylase family protein
MAGGKGTRLHPLTKDTPKPMLRVGDKPLMEIILGQLKEAGIRKVHVSTHHRADKITRHFGDGRGFGVDLSYINEESPLGTAGALGLLDEADETTLVMNGDVLTEVDFRAMLRYHREQRAELTVAVRQYEVKVPYGIVECDGPMVRTLTEKPTMEFFVSAGIYLIEPSVRRLFKRGERRDMTELIEALLAAGRPVASFPIREYWLDIGQHEDYRQAQDAARRLRGRR